MLELIIIDNYRAPELDDFQVNNQCDLWSLGVILYELCTNKYIFDSQNKEERENNRKNGIIKKTGYKMIDELIRKLIQVDIKERIKWEKYFDDEFFKNYRKVKEYYDNGKLKFEGEYFDGKRNGIGKEYYDNGKLEYKGRYLNGLRLEKYFIDEDTF